MASVRAIGMLAACLLLARDAAISRAATEDEDPAAPSTKKSDDPKDIKVLIPSYSKDVSDNGCRVRASPQEAFAGPDIDLRHVPFAELISETVGRYSVRAILDAAGRRSWPRWRRSMPIRARWSSSTCCATGSAATACTRSSL